jgi:hypothetical protein
VQYCPPKTRENPAIYGAYTNTSNTNAALSGQQGNQANARGLNLPFALYMTLTPQNDEIAMIVTYGAADAIEELAATLWFTGLLAAALEALALSLKATESMLPYKSLEELSSHINKDLYVNVMKLFANQSGPNDISMIYADFYENVPNVSLVDLAIMLSNRE